MDVAACPSGRIPWPPSILAGLLPERLGAESDGYVVDAVVKAMGDECMDVMGYGHHGCDGLVEVQLGHWLAIAGVYSKLRGLVREEPDGVGTGRQRNPSDRVLAFVEQLRAEHRRAFYRRAACQPQRRIEPLLSSAARAALKPWKPVAWSLHPSVASSVCPRQATL